MRDCVTQAVILSAGFGTRLRNITGENVPKVMVPLLGKPLLEHHIVHFKKHGIREFFVNLHHLPKKIKNYFEDGAKWNVKIKYALEEPEIMGTAGGIKNFGNQLKKHFFVVYGDMFSLLDYTSMAKHFFSKDDAIGTVLVGPSSHPRDSDLVEIDEKRRLKKIYVRPHEPMLKTQLTLLATYIFSNRVMPFIPPKTYYEIDRDLLPDLIEKKEAIYSYQCNDFLLDIGTPERYREVERFLKDKK